MKIFMDLLVMLGGVGIFLYGMKLMSRGIEQSAGAGVRNLFKKISLNRFTDYTVGVGITAIIQSSSATSVMTVGLANAGIIDNKQGAGIILGCKVGTTVTAFIVALSGVGTGGFSIGAVFASMAFVGVFISMVTKREGLEKFSVFLCGFGMLFLGLVVMQFAIGGKDSILSLEIQKLFAYDVMQNPIMLIILGLVFTMVIQSSSAATGIFIAFLQTGVLTNIDQAFFLTMGANIGTCIDGIMASIGTNHNGKRMALFHVLTSLIGAVVFSIILAIFRAPITDIFNRIFPTQLQWSLALYNLSYNLIYTLILLVFLTPILTLVQKIVKDKTVEQKKLMFIDDRLLITPSFAIEQTLNEVYHMAVVAKDNFCLAFDGIVNDDTSNSKKIAADEYLIDYTTSALASYIIKVSSRPISFSDENLLGTLHHVIADIERIGDHAVIYAKETNLMKQQHLKFLDETKEELKHIHQDIIEMYNMCLETFKTRKTTKLTAISEIHNKINQQITAARNLHTTRLNSGEYSIEVSKSLYAVLLSQERVADHLVNIAFSIKSNTGSKTEVFKKLEQSKTK